MRDHHVSWAMLASFLAVKSFSHISLYVCCRHYTNLPFLRPDCEEKKRIAEKEGAKTFSILPAFSTSGTVTFRQGRYTPRLRSNIPSSFICASCAHELTCMQRDASLFLQRQSSRCEHSSLRGAGEICINSLRLPSQYRQAQLKKVLERTDVDSFYASARDLRLECMAACSAYDSAAGQFRNALSLAMAVHTYTP